MLVSLLAIPAAVAGARAYVGYKLRRLGRVEASWDIFVHSSRDALSAERRTPALQELVADMSAILTHRHGSWILAYVIIKRGWLLHPLIRTEDEQRQKARSERLGRSEGELFTQVFFSAVSVFKRQEFLPGLIIRLWLTHLKMALRKRQLGAPAEVHEIGEEIHRGFCSAA